MEFALIFPIAPVLLGVIVALFIVGAGLSMGIENAAEALMNNADTVFWWCLVAGVVVALIIQIYEFSMYDYYDRPTLGIFLYTIPKAIALTSGFFYLILAIAELFSQWHWLLFIVIIVILLVFLLMALIFIAVPMIILTIIDVITNIKLLDGKKIIYIIAFIISLGLSIWFAWYTCAPGLAGDFSFYS